MKIKDLLEIINRDRWYKKQIQKYKSLPALKNIGDVLEHNYKKWLELEINECEVKNV